MLSLIPPPHAPKPPCAAVSHCHRCRSTGFEPEKNVPLELSEILFKAQPHHISSPLNLASSTLQHMQPRSASPSHLPHDSVASICLTSHSILDTCLNCPTGVQPFVPFASPLLRAHGDVLELDALCRTHVNISRRVAISQCVAAPVNHSAFTDAELPQASRRRPSLCFLVGSFVMV
jgi:hypothetical protein